MLTTDQLRLRKSGIGGSEVAAILGQSPWNTPAKIYADKTTDKIEVGSSDAMEWGSRLEGAILEKFGSENPHSLTEGTKTFRHPRHGCLLATPDGIYSSPKGMEIIEVKTASGEVWDEVPTYYQLQLQHYLYVMGAKKGRFAVLFNGREYREYGPYEAEESYEELVVPILLDFWNKVEARDPSGLEAVVAADLSIICPADDDSEMIADDEMLEMALKAKELTLQAKEAKAKADALKVDIAERMGHQKRLVSEAGEKLVSQFDVRRTRMDMKALKKDHPDLVEKYQLESVSRTVRL